MHIYTIKYILINKINKMLKVYTIYAKEDRPKNKIKKSKQQAYSQHH